MQATVYSITFNATGQFYIGSTANLHKRIGQHVFCMQHNCHSSIRMSECYAKYGDDFTVDVIATVNNRQQAYDIENQLLQINKHNQLLLNTTVNAKFGDTFTNNPNKESMRKHISEGVIKRNALLTDEQYYKMYVENRLGERNGRYIDGRSIKPNYCPICGTLIGPAAMTCKYHVNRFGPNNNFYGHRHTDATKAAIRQKNLGKIPTNARKISIDGVIYNSLAEAARTLHVVSATILHRCRSKNFPAYSYVD